MSKILDFLDRIATHPLCIRAANLVGAYWPILFRAFIYFAIEALPGVIKECRELGQGMRMANTWLLWGVGLESVYHGLIGLRAYFDGSSVTRAPRPSRINPAAPGGGGTEFFSKPQ